MYNIKMGTKALLAAFFIIRASWNYWQEFNQNITDISPNKSVQRSISYEAEIELEEIPELGYRNISDIRFGNDYVYYDNLLILGGILYKKQAGSFVKQKENLSDLLGVEYLRYKQYKNFIIVEVSDPESFLIYDMRTAYKYTYACEPGYEIFNWCIYDGNLLFDEYNREEGKDRLRQMDLTTKEIELIYQWDKGKYPEDIRIREDGIITYSCSCMPKKRECWQLKKDENGIWQKSLVWKTDENQWEYIYVLDFNQYGLIIFGEFFDPKENFSFYETVVITDSGEMVKLDDELSDNCIFMENGYLDGNRAELEKMPWEEGTMEAEYLSFYLADTVSFYDYEGNLQATYPMIDKKWLEQGYYLKRLIYHDEKITAFYVQNETEELYISQVKADLGK